MTFVRPARRVLIAAVSLSALLVAAACGGENPSAGGSTSSSAAGDAEYNNKGPIIYAQGKDNNGVVQPALDKWNAEHPDEKVTFLELAEGADQQRQQMLQNAQIKSDKMTVMSMDVVWTAEFAANGIADPLPDGAVDTGLYLPAAVDSVTYFNKLYAYPTDSDGGILYYRKDLLDAAGVTEPPKTWDELKAACDKVLAGSANSGIDCFAGQYDKYEGLTVNFDEAVHSAGGVIVGEDGKPNVNTPEAQKGLERLVSWFEDGTIPEGAITWKEENGRTAFQSGKLVFHRNWPYIYSRLSGDDNSKVKGKFAITALPGETGPGVSSLGGHNLAIAKYGKNKATAVEFIKWWNSPEQQKERVIKASLAPTLTSLYEDPELVKKYPYLTTLKASIDSAKPRPKAVKYGDVSRAIVDAAYGALQGQAAPDAALAQLQTTLEGLIQ